MSRLTQLAQNLTEFCHEVQETVPQQVQESVAILDFTTLVPGEKYFIQFTQMRTFSPEHFSFIGRLKKFLCLLPGYEKVSGAVFDSVVLFNGISESYDGEYVLPSYLTIPNMRRGYFCSCYIYCPGIIQRQLQLQNAFHHNATSVDA